MSSVALARTIVETLVAQGVEHVVLAPGSRNAPLSIALAAAEEQGLLSLHVRVDERSAAFVALGIGKATRCPAVVVTTSGTAVGNLVPAVMESRHAGVPLVVLSADRPVSMINSGASQTTPQLGIFAGHALDIARVSSESGDEAAWRHVVRRSLFIAAGRRSRQPGPVQLNVQFEVPLVGSELMTPLGQVPRLELDGSRPAEPAALPAGPRTVVVVGDGSPEHGAAAVALAEAAGVPLFAEPSSNARRGPNAIATYRLGLAELGERIERVVVYGHPTLSRPISRLLSRTDVEVIMVAPTAQWIDPGHVVARVVDGLRAEGVGDPGWLQQWRDLDARITADIAEDAPRRAALALWGSFSGDDVVVLGASNPIRDADLVPIPGEPPLVLANRGLAGIDGTVSTAIGVSLGLGRPVTAVMGDLTFLHDVSALVRGRMEEEPRVRVVVLDDAGGSIFHGLEQGAAAYERHFERVFGTPQLFDPLMAAEGLGVRAVRVTDADALAAELARPIEGLEVVVVPIDRDSRPRP